MPGRWGWGDSPAVRARVWPMQKIVKERINIPLDAINIIGIGLLLYGAGVLSHSIGIVLLYFRLAEHSLHIDCSHKKREDTYNMMTATMERFWMSMATKVKMAEKEMLIKKDAPAYKSTVPGLVSKPPMAGRPMTRAAAI